MVHKKFALVISEGHGVTDVHTSLPSRIQKPYEPPEIQLKLSINE